MARALLTCVKKTSFFTCVKCEDRVLDGPASRERAPRVGPKYCNPRTRMKYHRSEAVPWLPRLSHEMRGRGAAGRGARSPCGYRGTSLIRPPPPVGPCSRPMPRDIW